MAISNEIEKLERRWQQTSGLVFAPLAEAYRKAGLHARALEILEQGLALHPDYGPALIVRGRCHLDTGTLPEAEQAFLQALARDPMDPIALRGIADVYERTGRYGDAIERLQLVVDLDPRNVEARQVLERLMAAPAPATEPGPEPALGATESAPPAEDAPSPEPLDELSFEVVNLAAEEVVPVLPEVAAAPAEEEDFRIESFAVEAVDAASWRAEALHEANTLDAFEPTALVPGAPEPAPVEAEPPAEEPAGPVLWTPAPTVEPVAEPAPALALEAEPVAEPVVGSMAGSVAESVEEPVAQSGVEPAAESMEEPVAESVEEPAAEPIRVAEVEPEPVAESPAAEYASAMEEPVSASAEPPMVEAPAVEEPVIEEPASQEEPAGLIVTESMAELFLKQGHRELALAVYRQLRERSPGSESITVAIARLEEELAPPPAPASEPREFAAARTGGRSVESLLRRVLDAEPPAAATRVLPPAIEPVSGEPARAAGDALPLSAVFGDEPAVPPRAEPAAAEGAAEPSYDEFFGAVAGGEPAAAGGSRSGEGEDLRQFNEWLKGLKR